MLLLAAILTGCAAGTVVEPFGSGGRVWPESPNTPRIEFVREFSSLADFGVKASLWARIVQAVAGKESDRMIRPMAVAMTVDGSTIYVADPDAGTFREMVEAAETCQVAIIHPGQPRNSEEPGLEELLVRAEPFN